ncbi:DUF5655 domain-containing protein [Ferrimonas sp. SCSIO 43195]|uniref:DUF5655 domain-containing protein n=1 Tax=Ferrimonas sp. SCSIO 43195 TaxID=2822844 RepID=UPI002075B355|nr:DUF5655 domain-containing protein [Ferrimonas sp. SCSIO 43195]USD35987.1 DUF91 domain-containing protein [Ferrimonas sp. SCSIO 43195]
MSDIKLFRYGAESVTELESKAAVVEKQLQQLIEEQMEAFLGVRFLATEYSTGKTHKGRIDSLGLDENGCPVIIEYKRHTNENVINQGLFYLDWLLDHQAEFRWLVMEKLGKDAADNIEWDGTRLLCIAGDFTKYDEHAVQQINRNIELLRYKLFANDLLMLELVNAITTTPSPKSRQISTQTESKPVNGERRDTHSARIEQADDALMSLYEAICDFTESLGEEVQRKELKLYTAFKKIRNFACVQIWAPQRDPQIRMYLKLNPDEVTLEANLVSDVRDKGHWGTGDVEVLVRSHEDWQKVQPLIERAYQEN